MDQRQLTSYFFLLPFTLLFTLVISYPSGNHYQHSTLPTNTHAILIAGTSGWFNYRHQANIAHGYQILRSHGVPEENIIVMSPDDVAHSGENPFQGKLFNSPKSGDVYSGLKVDYSGNQVTLINFLNILKGLTGKSLPKVLRSGPNDSVFIYISSYGSTGLISLPNDILTSAVFNQALIDLKANQKFSHLMVYLDSDYSGSMFDSVLSENISVYSVASTNQVNLACYCNNSLIPFTCLASSFSISWLSNSGSRRTLNDETLAQQFAVIIQSLDHSKPLSPATKLTPGQYGDLNLSTLPLGQFMGSHESVTVEKSTLITDQLSTYDVPLEMTKEKVKITGNEELSIKIINSRRSFDRAFYRLIDDLCWVGYCSNATNILTTTSFESTQLTNHNIYHSVVTKFHSDCLNIAKASYAMSKMYAFANIISESQVKLSQQLDKFLPSLYQACRRRIINHGYEDII